MTSGDTEVLSGKTGDESSVRNSVTALDARSVWLVLVFLLAAYTNVLLVAQRWGDPLLDQHDFRQTQTAMSVWRMLNGGPLLAYETPVLGKPWSVPFEFPLYQWVVAGLVRVTAMPLDQAGRLVSVAAFYLLLIPLGSILGHVCPNRAERLIPLTLLLASPLYIFWSRAFMIESTALLLSAIFVAAFLRSSIRPDWLPLTVTAVAGALAGMVKVTTFAVAAACVAVVFTSQLVARVSRRELRGLVRRTVVCAAPIAVATVATLAWSAWTEVVRAHNPMANGFVTSATLRGWVLGTLQQRLAPDVWFIMFWRSGPEILGRPADALIAPLTLVGIFAVASRRYWKPALLSLLTFVAGPLLFMNLYVVHNYYFYENGIALIIFGGLGVLALIERGGRAESFAVWIAVPLLTILLFRSFWWTSYADPIRPKQLDILRTAHAITRVTAPDDVVVIYGNDWNPAIPYYARRRALMDRWPLRLDDPRIRKAMAELGGERIGAVVIGGNERFDTAFVRQRVAFFGLAERPAARTLFGDVYVRRDHGE